MNKIKQFFQYSNILSTNKSDDSSSENTFTDTEIEAESNKEYSNNSDDNNDNIDQDQDIDNNHENTLQTSEETFFPLKTTLSTTHSLPPSLPIINNSSTIKSQSIENAPLTTQENDQLEEVNLVTRSGKSISYKLMSLKTSQYSLKAISACTNISFQAIFDTLNCINSKVIPFGLSKDLLSKILTTGSQYKENNHQYLDEVIKNRSELMTDSETGLYYFQNMINVDPYEPQNGLKKGREYTSMVKSNVGCIFTSQSQSICIIYIYDTNNYVIFDSHSRTHNKQSYGASFLFFESFTDLCCYITYLFPRIDQPKNQSEVEKIQYSYLSCAQADYFCLKKYHAEIQILPSKEEMEKEEKEEKIENEEAKKEKEKEEGILSTVIPYSRRFSPPTAYLKSRSDYLPVENRTISIPIEELKSKFSYELSDLRKNLLNVQFENKQYQLEIKELKFEMKRESDKWQESLFLQKQMIESSLQALKEKINDLEKQNKLMNKKIQLYESKRKNKSKNQEQDDDDDDNNNNNYNNNNTSSNNNYNHGNDDDDDESGDYECKTNTERKFDNQQSRSSLNKKRKSSISNDEIISSKLLKTSNDSTCQENNDQTAIIKKSSELNPSNIQYIEIPQNDDHGDGDDDECKNDNNDNENDYYNNIEKEQENYILRMMFEENDLEYIKTLHFDCTICLEKDIDIQDVFFTDHEDLKICRNCATSYIQQKIKEGKIPIKCFCSKFDCMLSESKCFEVLDEDYQRQYHNTDRVPRLDPKYRHCLTPDCDGYYLLEENSTVCTCCDCGLRWCNNCGVDLVATQHKNISCELYQKWKQENDECDTSFQRLVDDGLRDKDGIDRIRACPKCKHLYSKDDQCNHVLCESGCGVHFCFRCANYYSDNSDDIYLHQGDCPGYIEPT